LLAFREQVTNLGAGPLVTCMHIIWSFYRGTWFLKSLTIAGTFCITTRRAVLAHAVMIMMAFTLATLRQQLHQMDASCDIIRMSTVDDCDAWLAWRSCE